VISVSISRRPLDTKKISKVVIFNESGKVLLLLRKEDQPFPNKWDLPGGHLLVGETWEQGAIREAKEETNLDLNNLEMILDKGKNKYFKTSDFVGDIFNKEDLPEHNDFVWVAPEELAALNISKIYVNAIRSALE